MEASSGSPPSRRFPREDYEADLIEHSGTGRLLRRDPSGAVEVLLDGLQFSNGVALAPDESFVLFAETGAYRITKLWLTGDRSGQTDTFAENLPGFPDNISTGPSGLIWVALPSPRNPMLDRLLPLPPIFRRMAWGLPDPLRPRAERTMWVMAFDLDGRPVHDLQRGGDRYRMVTGVREYGGRVYLGSIDEDAVAVLDLPTGHKATHPPSRP